MTELDHSSRYAAKRFFETQLTESQRRAWYDSRPTKDAGWNAFCTRYYTAMTRDEVLAPPPGMLLSEWRLL